MPPDKLKDQKSTMRYLVLKFGHKSVFSDTAVGFPNIVAKFLGEEIESRILNHRNPLTALRGLCVRQVYLVVVFVLVRPILIGTLQTHTKFLGVNICVNQHATLVAGKRLTHLRYTHQERLVPHSTLPPCHEANPFLPSSVPE